MLSFVVNGVVLRHVTMGKAQGQSWESIATEAEVPPAELAELPWRYSQQWDTHYPRAAELTRQERIARCTAKLEDALLASDEPRDMVLLSKALTCFLKLQEPKTQRQKASSNTEHNRAKTKQPEVDHAPPAVKPPLATQSNPPDKEIHTNGPSDIISTTDTKRNDNISPVTKPEPTVLDAKRASSFAVLLFFALCVCRTATPETTAPPAPDKHSTTH